MSPAPASAPEPAHEKIEPILKLLFIGMVVFLGALFACEILFKDDGQIFQVVAGLLAGFSGAFFGRINPKRANGATTVSTEPPRAA